MAWKIISKALGATEGGGIGAVLAAVRAAVGLDAPGGRADKINRAAFTAAVIGLSAKLSKSDGVALEIEAETFERLFPVPDGEIENVRRLFRLAAGDVAGYESYAAQVARALADEPGLKRNVFDALLHIASADGVLHPGEDRFLATVAATFGYSPADYEAMRACFIVDAADPYVILGIGREANDAALKAHYLKLVREHHPDALASKGLGDELRGIAERKLATLNAAWDEIAKERGL
jgi:DnaJ like chaperone protein